MKKAVRRWRLWSCIMGKRREEKAELEIDYLKRKGFKAKINAPLPRHKTSGHTHIVVLATLDELLSLTGVKRK